jgi:hypothetical protein
VARVLGVHENVKVLKQQHAAPVSSKCMHISKVLILGWRQRIDCIAQPPGNAHCDVVLRWYIKAQHHCAGRYRDGSKRHYAYGHAVHGYALQVPGIVVENIIKLAAAGHCGGQQ